METVSVALYHFDELSKEAQEKALDDWRRGDNNDWEFENDMLIDSFIEQAGEYGISFEGVKNAFSWETYSQGAGLTFDFGEWDIEKLFKKRGLSWNKYRMVHTYFKHGYASVISEVHYGCCSNRDISVALSLSDEDTIHGEIKNPMWREKRAEKLEQQIDDLEEQLQGEYDSICADFLSQVYEHYEYLDSDEYIKEMMEMNDIKFTKDGTRW